MEVIGFRLDDVLDLAIQMETNGVEFYENAARSTPQGAGRLLLDGLAAMEKSHKAAFVSLKERRGIGTPAGDSDVDAAISSFLTSWLDGEVFDRDMEKSLGVARSGAIVDILRVAIRMEKDSIAFYTGLREYVANDEAEPVLDWVIKDELQHVGDLNTALLELRGDARDEPVRSQVVRSGSLLLSSTTVEEHLEGAQEGQGKAPQEFGGKVLVVEDEEPLRRAYGRWLEMAGFGTLLAASGGEAVELVEQEKISAIISDINMPGMDGMDLLRAIRERDLDLPVILVTGSPTIESAARAVEYGALRYLVKPVEKDELVETVGRAVKLNSIARLKREAAAYLGGETRPAGDRAGLEASLTRGLETLWMAYQPIVNPRRKQTVAFEALVRCREPTIPHPGVLFSVAERLGRVQEVGRAIRASVARTLAERRPESDIFINLHPSDLLDETLYSHDSPMSPFAHQVVLEITERAALDCGADIPGRIRRLRNLGFRVAIDDLGAGYAGLSYFALLTPDVVKLDITLIRNIHQEEIKRKLVGSLTSLCKDLGMLVVAEGVETAEERDTVAALGCDLLQGFIFAKPSPPFPEVSW